MTLKVNRSPEERSQAVQKACADITGLLPTAEAIIFAVIDPSGEGQLLICGSTKQIYDMTQRINGMVGKEVAAAIINEIMGEGQSPKGPLDDMLPMPPSVQ